MNTRALGTLCMVGGLFGMAAGVRLAVNGSSNERLDYILNIVFFCGVLSGLLGVFFAKAAGTSAMARIVSILPIIAFCFVIAEQVTHLMNPQAEFPFIFGPIALLSVLILGIFVIAAKRWSGWRRFSPLFHIAAIVFAGVTVMLGLPPLIALFLGIAWLLIGYAVRTAPVRADTGA